MTAAEKREIDLQRAAYVRGKTEHIHKITPDDLYIYLDMAKEKYPYPKKRKEVTIAGRIYQLSGDGTIIWYRSRNEWTPFVQVSTLHRLLELVNNPDEAEDESKI